MGIYFGGFYAGVSQYFLDVPKVDALLQQVGSEAVAQGVGGGVFVNPGLFQGFLKDIRDAGSTIGTSSLAFKQPVFGFIKLVVISQEQ